MRVQVAKETFRKETEARPSPWKDQKGSKADLNFEGYEELVRVNI